MGAFKNAHDDETRALFGKLRRNQFRGKPGLDTVPQEGRLGPAVPLSFGGSDVFNDSEDMEVMFWVPDVFIRILEVKALIAFRPFWATASAAESGGGSTSGSGGASAETTTGSPHAHLWAEHVSDSPGGYTSRQYQDGLTGRLFNLTTQGAVDMNTAAESGGGHDHTVTIDNHTHSTPDHDHDLEYGIFRESIPGAPYDVEVRVDKWDGDSWELVGGSLQNLTARTNEVEFTNDIDGPGQYRLRIISDTGTPNDGRLGCDVTGYVVGAIQP